MTSLVSEILVIFKEIVKAASLVFETSLRPSGGDSHIVGSFLFFHICDFETVFDQNIE
jgi:hypothetical protein